VSERAAFVSAILNNLADDTPRLVFADWLQEHGDEARAEFIRCQIEAEKLPAKGRSKTKPVKRAAALLKKHENQWCAVAGLSEHRGAYVRGFIEGVRACPGDLARLTSALAVEPFTVRLWFGRRGPDDEAEPTPAWFRKLAANPMLATVVSMDSETSGMGHELFSPLVKSPHLKNLGKIIFFEDYIGPKGVKAIADSPAPFMLRHLNLNSGIGYGEVDEEEAETVAAVKVLATHPRFASLTELGLPFNSLGNKSVELLLKSKTLARELRLGLGEDNLFDRAYTDRLAARFKLVDYV
jgi:uncharacterized protein (TIGR02996 family)